MGVDSAVARHYQQLRMTQSSKRLRRKAIAFNFNFALCRWCDQNPVSRIRRLSQRITEDQNHAADDHRIERPDLSSVRPGHLIDRYSTRTVREAGGQAS
jgi:hypothetical protein